MFVGTNGFIFFLFFFVFSTPGVDIISALNESFLLQDILLLSKDQLGTYWPAINTQHFYCGNTTTNKKIQQ
jgi:hypothetical protein